MEIDLNDKKSQAIFHQALQGFAQIILIKTVTGPVTPTESQVRQLALSTLDINVDHFTKRHNFHLDVNTHFSDHKTTTNDTLPV
jgi:hypothetical protein